MLIKTADDKSEDLETLKGLLHHPAADEAKRRLIEQEIRNLSSGIKGENEAAYEINFHYGNSGAAVLHDLRLEHNGLVAQIDHLLINRLMQIWVFESKRVIEGIGINTQGECTTFWNGKPRGIPSPHEQNAKHIAVLKALCRDGGIELPLRLGVRIQPSFQSLILVSKNARISRPKSKGWWDSGIVKADQIKMALDKAADQDYNFLQAAKFVSAETVEALGKRFAALHKPASFNWHAKFGLTNSIPPEVNEPAAPYAAISPSPSVVSRKPSLTPACAKCGVEVEEKVASFCKRFNKARFGGDVYCMDCQSFFPKIPKQVS